MHSEHFEFESVVPHSDTMALLDTVANWSDDSLEAHVTLHDHSPFAEEKGVPAWVGIEYMAQAVGAFAGCHARKSQRPVQIGFLVGSRRYQTNQPYFPLGTPLSVQVTEVLQASNGLSVFECSISSPDCDIKASANLNVFQPDDPEDFLQGQEL